MVWLSNGSHSSAPGISAGVNDVSTAVSAIFITQYAGNRTVCTIAIVKIVLHICVIQPPSHVKSIHDRQR